MSPMPLPEPPAQSLLEPQPCLQPGPPPPPAFSSASCPNLFSCLRLLPCLFFCSCFSFLLLYLVLCLIFSLSLLFGLFLFPLFCLLQPTLPLPSLLPLLPPPLLPSQSQSPSFAAGVQLWLHLISGLILNVLICPG